MRSMRYRVSGVGELRCGRGGVQWYVVRGCHVIAAWRLRGDCALAARLCANNVVTVW